MKMQRHIMGGLGFLVALVPIWHFVSFALDIGGYADFIIAHRQNPGWVGYMLRFVIDPPNWEIIPLFFIAVALIWADVRLTLSKQAKGRGATGEQIQFARRKLLRFGKQRRDKTINQCVHYIINSDWDGSGEKLPGNANFYQIEDALLTIRQQALDGSIKLWGKRDDIWETISNEFWRTNKIEFSISPKIVLRSLPFSELMGSKKQFESIDWKGCRMKSSVETFGDLWRKRTTNLPDEPPQAPVPQQPQSKR